MGISIDVGVFAGSDINEVCSEIIALANKLSLTVMCRFNGVKLMACPGDDPVSLAARWEVISGEGNNELKIARGYPPQDKSHE